MMEHERWDRVFSATNLEMNQINDWLNLERQRSSSARVRLMGDDFCVVARQKQMQTRCELSMWKSWFVNVMTDWKSNSSRDH